MKSEEREGTQIDRALLAPVKQIASDSTPDNRPTTVRRVKQTVTETPKRKRTAAYCRVSSDKEEMLHSLSTQVSYYNQYIQRHSGWEFAGVYADEGITGTKDARPHFQQMLEDCRAGKIDLILTKKISRFARNTVTLLETVRELKAMGIDVYFEEDNIHSMSGDGELMLTILASFAQAESKSVSDNCRWRIHKNFAEGKPINLMQLYGYKAVDGKIVIDEEEAAVIRSVFMDYLHGKGSVQIARRLRYEQVPNRRGGIWSTNHVLKILTNEKYTGDSLLQKTYVEDHLSKKRKRNSGQLNKYFAENTHPAIIDHETFEQAKRIMDEHSEQNNVRKSSAVRYPFTEKIVCGNCGANYNRRTRSRGRNSALSYSWQCKTYKQGVRYCQSYQVPEETLKEITCEVLGVSEVTDSAMERLEMIRVVGSELLQFVFPDGHIVERQWEWKSRAASWTPEMKLKASEQMRRRHANK